MLQYRLALVYAGAIVIAADRVMDYGDERDSPGIV